MARAVCDCFEGTQGLLTRNVTRFFFLRTQRVQTPRLSRFLRYRHVREASRVRSTQRESAVADVRGHGASKALRSRGSQALIRPRVSQAMESVADLNEIPAATGARAEETPPSNTPIERPR